MKTRFQTTRWLVFLSVLLMAGTHAGTAHAQNASKVAAKAHADKALKEYNLGHFSGAISEYEQAYEIDPAPILLFNIATAHRKAGNDDKAVFFFGRYLDQAPDAPNRADVEQKIRELKTKIAKQGESSKEPVAPAAASPGPPPVTPPPAAATLVTTSPQSDSPVAAPPDGRHGLRTGAWVAGASAVVALGVGIGLQIAENQKFHDFDKSCGVNEKGEIVMGGSGPPVDCVGLHQRWEDSKPWPVIGYVASGAFAITAVTLFFFSRPSEESKGDRSALLGCHPGPGTLSCRFVF